MPRGIQLVQIVQDLRAEIGHSLNPALGQNARAALVRVLQRVQNHLHTDFDWPHLVVERDVALEAGQRYYGFPADLIYERILSAHVKHGSNWIALDFGVEPEHLALYDSDNGVRGAPVLRWAPHETTQFEAWPVPSDNAMTLRFKGVRKLGSFANDTDVCDLDSDMLIMFAAAEFLGQQKNPRADKLLRAANALYAKLKGQGASNKRPVWVMGGGGSGRPVPGKIGIPYAPRRG